MLFIHNSLACLFAICALLALAAPLYACDASVGKAASTASTVSKGKSAVVIKQGQPAAQAAKQQAASKKSRAIKQKVAAKKKTVQKEKPPVKVASVDFNVLKERLKDTDAIGFFTKLAIRNDIVDLMDKIKKYRKQSKLKVKIKEIRSSFDGLLLKIIALLEGDPKLSRDLYVGRESIWESLLEEKA